MKYHIDFDIEFKRNTSKGKYIVIEGIDGSGKTTQVTRLTNYFLQQKKEIIQVREPRKDEGLIGELIQKILQGKTTVPPVAFQYLFSADRAMHHSEVIMPALRQGKLVISDRCFWSAIPYGIMDREGSVDDAMGEWLLVSQSILSFYHQFTLPDYTFYLDVPLETALQRLSQSSEEHEIYEDKQKLQKTIKGYYWLLKKFPKEFIVINATKSVEEVTEEILSVINK
jgi:dTMP kinase